MLLIALFCLVYVEGKCFSPPFANVPMNLIQMTIEENLLPKQPFKVAIESHPPLTFRHFEMSVRHVNGSEEFHVSSFDRRSEWNRECSSIKSTDEGKKDAAIFVVTMNEGCIELAAKVATKTIIYHDSA